MKVYFRFSFLDGLILVLFIVGVSGFIILPFQSKNNQGILYMFKKDHEAANEVFIKCLNNKLPVCRMNIALNHFFLKRYIESIKEYTIVKQHTENNDFLFYTSFNSAVSATANQDRNLALKFYQDSLFYRPHSIEVKTNIELLFRQEQNQKQPQEQTDQQDQKKQDSSEDNKEKKNKQDTNKGDSQESKEQQEDLEKSDLREGEEEKNKQDMKAQERSLEQEKQSAQKFSKKQIQAILKSILDQEKQIRKKQQESQMRSPVLEKDW